MSTIDIFRHFDNKLEFKAGQVIVDAGSTGHDMYVVGEGEAEIHVGGRVVETVGPGKFFGEMALIDDSPRSATVVAKTDVKLVPVSRERFMFLVQNTPYFAIEVMQSLVSRLRHMDTLLAN
ncbi:MAG TPA: cyclic nucleotide-binding domain-containing protein [Candidatus Acidoferrales bacterium]|nr:cyclic nucleotide-binding domain-containing protein [Candidatus Acidoferrales bacterium]